MEHQDRQIRRAIIDVVVLKRQDNLISERDRVVMNNVK